MAASRPGHRTGGGSSSSHAGWSRRRLSGRMRGCASGCAALPSPFMTLRDERRRQPTAEADAHAVERQESCLVARAETVTSPPRLAHLAERSRRPRGARGPCRGADRGGQETRTASPTPERGSRDPRRARRSRALRRSRTQRAVTDCIPRALRAVELAAPAATSRIAFLAGALSPSKGRFRADRALRHERRRQRQAQVGAP